MEQLLLHLIGDYVTQSHWMASEKTRMNVAALAHSIVYSLPFLLIGSWSAVSVIWITHYFIDRYRLARYVVYWKNVVGSPRFWVAAKNKHKHLHWSFENCPTGYPTNTPDWLAVWLLIAADNTLHLTINYLALLFL